MRDDHILIHFRNSTTYWHTHKSKCVYHYVYSHIDSLNSMEVIDFISFKSLKASQFKIISQFTWITPKTKGRQPLVARILLLISTTTTPLPLWGPLMGYSCGKIVWLRQWFSLAKHQPRPAHPYDAWVEVSELRVANVKNVDIFTRQRLSLFRVSWWWLGIIGASHW